MYNSIWRRPICNVEFFIEISQGLLRTAPGLVGIFRELGKSSAVLGNLELSCQGLKSTGMPVRVDADKFMLKKRIYLLCDFRYVFSKISGYIGRPRF